MVQTLRILESNLDNERDDEPNTVQQAIRCPDFLKSREVEQAE